MYSRGPVDSTLTKSAIASPLVAVISADAWRLYSIAIAYADPIGVVPLDNHWLRSVPLAGVQCSEDDVLSYVCELDPGLRDTSIGNAIGAAHRLVFAFEFHGHFFITFRHFDPTSRVDDGFRYGPEGQDEIPGLPWPPVVSAPTRRWARGCQYAEIAALYQRLAVPAGWPMPRELPKAQIRSLWQQHRHEGKPFWVDLFRHAAAQPRPRSLAWLLNHPFQESAAQAEKAACKPSESSSSPAPSSPAAPPEVSTSPHQEGTPTRPDEEPTWSES